MQTKLNVAGRRSGGARKSARGKSETVSAPPISRLVAAKAGALENGIPYTTLRDLAFNGKIQVVKLGRAWYFDRRDLARLIDGAKETLR